MKKIVAICIAALALATTSIPAFAATYQNTAEAVAGVTGKTIDEVVTERQAGKSYGNIALEAGKLSEFHQAVLEIRKEALNQLVADGRLTQAESDAQISAMEKAHENCDGTGSCDGLAHNSLCSHDLGSCIGHTTTVAGSGIGRRHGMGHGRGMGHCANR